MSSESSAPEPSVTLVERGVAVKGVRLAAAMNDTSRALLARVPLIVLPAAAFTWQDYTLILEHFAPERRVFALDWPGFGASEKPAPAAFTYSAASYAEMLAGWIDGLGIARAVLLGNGIGATAALTYAATHPTRVLGLALSGPLGFGAGGRFGRMAGRALGTSGAAPAAGTAVDLAGAGAKYAADERDCATATRATRTRRLSRVGGGLRGPLAQPGGLRR